MLFKYEALPGLSRELPFQISKGMVSNRGGMYLGLFVLSDAE
jgi:hypothetical protein